MPGVCKLERTELLRSDITDKSKKDFKIVKSPHFISGFGFSLSWLPFLSQFICWDLCFSSGDDIEDINSGNQPISGQNKWVYSRPSFCWKQRNSSQSWGNLLLHLSQLRMSFNSVVTAIVCF